MSLPTPPLTGTYSPPVARPYVLEVLISHLETGSIQPHGYDLLYDVLKHIDEISLLLFPASTVLEAPVRRRIESLACSIIEVFYFFGEHVDRKLHLAREAMQELPDLAKVTAEKREEHLQVWREGLSKLHKPSNKDVKLYRQLLAYFDDEVYEPLLELHQEQPDHCSWQLRHWLNTIRDCVIGIYENVEDANKLVVDLDAEFTFATWGMREMPLVEQANEDKGLSPIEETETLAMFLEESKSPPIDCGALLAQTKSALDALDSLDDFFDLSRTVSKDESQPSAQAEYDVTPSKPEKGSKVPRVFKGSFLELESSVKNLRLHSVNSSIDAGSDADGAIKVKDFAVHTPCLLPSPATLLERRDALSTRDPTWEHRLIGGQVMQSRRPHDRNRAHTVDERGAGLEAWLAETPSPDRAVERAGGARMRVLHGQQTL